VTRVGGGRVRGALLAGRFGGLGLKTIGGGFHRFGPQNLGGGPEAWAELPRRDGRHVAASGSSRRSEATGEEARWPSDRIIPSRTKLALGLVVWLMYLGVVWRRGIRTI